MKVYSKFDESLLGEAEGSQLESEQVKDRVVNPLRIGRILMESLRNLRNDRDMINVYSNETGKTILSCRQEIDTSILFLEISGIGNIYEKYGERSVSSRSFTMDRVAFLDEGMPVFSIVNQIVRNLTDGKSNLICHSPDAPLTTMYLAEKITDAYEESNSIFFHIVEEWTGIKEKIDKFSEQAYIWGSEEHINQTGKLINGRQVFRITSNFPVIVRNYSSISQALDQIMQMSFNSISNSGLRAQVYFVQDQDFIFFRNQLTELLKRKAENYYGPESSVNYFPSKSHSENTRGKVASLLHEGWDYINDLPDTVHVLVDQYGEIPDQVQMLDGPVIQIMHYSSMMDCAKRIERMDFGDRINVFGDSLNDLEFLREFFGSQKKVINGRSVNEIMSDFIV